MLENLQPPEASRSCRIGSILADLDEPDQVILNDALADQVRWSSHALMIALKERGVQVSIHPIINHRRGICKCSKI
jgi:hypothetical protein